MDTSWIRGRGDQEVVDAMVKANADKARLVDLVRRGILRRVGPANALTREVEALAFPQRSRGLDTIRPKKRKKSRKR